MAPQRKSQYWCFTYNNYTDADIARLLDLDGVDYIVFGYEIAEETGTPHLQGYVEFTNRRTFNAAKRAIGERCHLEPRRGSAYQAAGYCIKDGDFEERGARPTNVPVRSGNQGKFAAFCSYCTEFYEEHARSPRESEYCTAFPDLFVRYRTNLSALVGFICPPVELQQGGLRDWQERLNDALALEPDDRSVHFVIDKAGGKGKSFFMRWFFTQHPEKTQLLSIGKRDDIAHAVDVHKSVFLFNVPRGGMEFLQYTILEQIKDRVVFSPKYNSETKLMRENTHVVVFCNEEPDYEKMSADRFNVIRLD